MRNRGFTLLETIFVIVVLALCATTVIGMMPQVWKAQNESRDEYAGLVQMQACAERLIGARRALGYASVTTGTCSSLSGLGGFATPQVVLRNAANASISACDSNSATCTATITIARSSGPSVSIAPLTLQFSVY